MQQPVIGPQDRKSRILSNVIYLSQLVCGFGRHQRQPLAKVFSVTGKSVALSEDLRISSHKHGSVLSRESDSEAIGQRNRMFRLETRNRPHRRHSRKILADLRAQLRDNSFCFVLAMIASQAITDLNQVDPTHRGAFTLKGFGHCQPLLVRRRPATPTRPTSQDRPSCTTDARDGDPRPTAPPCHCQRIFLAALSHHLLASPRCHRPEARTRRQRLAQDLLVRGAPWGSQLGPWHPFAESYLLSITRVAEAEGASRIALELLR